MREQQLGEHSQSWRRGAVWVHVCAQMAGDAAAGGRHRRRGQGRGEDLTPNHPNPNPNPNPNG